MADEISGYRAGEDAYFSARAADLEDIRDRVLGHLAPAADGAPIPGGSVVVATDLPLSRFLGIDWAQGGAIVLTEGSPTSHVAMLARARRVPMVVGLGAAADCDGRPRGAGRRRQRRSGARSDGRHPHRLRREGRPRRGRSRCSRSLPSAAGGNEGRNRDLREPQRRERRRARRDRSRDLRRHWPRAHGTHVLRTWRAAGRGGAIRGLSPHRCLGSGASRHHTDPGRWRRQTHRRRDDERRKQSVPRRSGDPIVVAPSRSVPNPASRARARAQYMATCA